MKTDVYFHGTTGDNILSIIETGLMKPDQKHEIFFSRYRWDSCLMHGADRKRKAGFVVKVEVDISDKVKHVFRETPGVHDTVILQTADPLPVRVLELFVRRLNEDGAQLEHLMGAPTIKRYLGG